jgi:hypothetical protein
MAAADIDRKIIVQGNGSKITFEAIDHTITGFKIEVGTGDAGGFAQLGFAGATGFALSHQKTPADAAGKLASSAVCPKASRAS